MGDDDTVNKSFSHQTTSVYTELLAVKEGSNARVGSVGVILLLLPPTCDPPTLPTNSLFLNQIFVFKNIFLQQL